VIVVSFGRKAGIRESRRCVYRLVSSSH